MSGNTRGLIKERTDCPQCGRDTAVAWNKRNGNARVGPHKDQRTGVRCVAVGRELSDRSRVRPSPRHSPGSRE